jgi:phosphatidylethanolamine/phosphatidyl-N-methylethanolamine N-methyltransferase
MGTAPQLEFGMQMTNIRFARTWLRSPRSTGSLVPSSESLAAALVAALPDDDYDLVVELGTGEGSVTRQLVARFGGERVVGVELDSGLAMLARAQAPEATVIVGDACRLLQLLERRAGAGKTAVVSCLPLINMPRTRKRVLGAVRSLIAPHGHLVQFTYAPWQPYPKRECRIFSLIGTRAGRVLRNLPPASVWLYRPGPGTQACIASGTGLTNHGLDAK